MLRQHQILNIRLNSEHRNTAVAVRRNQPVKCADTSLVRALEAPNSWAETCKDAVHHNAISNGINGSDGDGDGSSVSDAFSSSISGESWGRLFSTRNL